MKKLLTIMTILSSLAAHSAELQLHECTFKTTTIEFTPSQALTALIRKEVKGSVVYKVKYKYGQTVTGPRDDLAVVDELPSKTLGVTFFQHDEEDGVVHSKNAIWIDLKSPVATDAPLILFSANLSGEGATKGKCGLSLL